MQQTALVTGAASGMGLATGARFVSSRRAVLAVDVGESALEQGAARLVPAAAGSWTASDDAPAVSLGQLVYGASRAAVVSITRSLAHELAGDGIVANSVVPGWVDTPGNAATGRMETAAASIPVGRVGRPDEIVDRVSQVARPGYVTGETLVLSGGSSMR